MLSFATLLLLAPTIYAQSKAIQVVTVGEGGAIQYSPDSITAEVGSQVEFQFFGPAHSVVQASFAEPCTAINNGAGFFAGMQTSGSGPNPNSFTITINDTNPIWFYCAFPGHCQAGMVGVINQSPSDSSKTLDNFRAAAANTSKSTTPPQQQGGVIGPFVAATNGTESSTSTSTASSASSTTEASPSGSSPATTPSGAPTPSSNSTGSAPGTTAPGTTSPSSPAGTSPPIPTGGAAHAQFTLFGVLAGLIAALI
jgi:plastocyanin